MLLLAQKTCNHFLTTKRVFQEGVRATMLLLTLTWSTVVTRANSCQMASWRPWNCTACGASRDCFLGRYIFLISPERLLKLTISFGYLRRWAYFPIWLGCMLRSRDAPKLSHFWRKRSCVSRVVLGMPGTNNAPPVLIDIYVKPSGQLGWAISKKSK